MWLVGALIAFSVAAQTGAGFKNQVLDQPRPPSATEGGPMGPNPPVTTPPEPLKPPIPESDKAKYDKPYTSDQDQATPPGMDAEPELFEGSSGYAPSGAAGEYFGPGKMQACGEPPASAKKAFDDAVKFRSQCGWAQRGENQKIAINDFATRPSMMYIYDLSGKCLGKTMVAFGNGARGAQVACSDANSHLSPPGFHITATHNGAKYNSNNSLKMVGLQGQGSSGRAILIHPTRAPGTSSTWGCAGVGYGAFGAVKKTLGLGALVYNAFPPSQVARNCGNKAGSQYPPDGSQCRPDPGAPAVPQNATGSGSPAVSYHSTWIEPAYAAQFPERLKIKKGTEIVLLAYQKASDTYVIKMVKEEAQGPNVAATEALIESLNLKESVKDFHKRTSRDRGAIYILKRDLPLLWEEEVFKRVRKK